VEARSSTRKPDSTSSKRKNGKKVNRSSERSGRRRRQAVRDLAPEEILETTESSEQVSDSPLAGDPGMFPSSEQSGIFGEVDRILGGAKQNQGRDASRVQKNKRRRKKKRKK
jgi:hypothetical protein